MEDKYTRITLRIPKELHEKLQHEADISSKSMNAEIVARLEQSFSAQNQLDVTAINEIIEQTIKTTLENIEPKNFSFKKTFTAIDPKDVE